MKYLLIVLVGFLVASICGPARAAWLLEIDTDALDDGVLTYNSNFSYGGDTTTASQSAASTAVGLTGGDSIFGGDGANEPDTYLYAYTPGTDADNLQLPQGTPLNDDGDFASGAVVGGAGVYNVYGTWPLTMNVSGGPTLFELSDSSGVVFSTTIDQSPGGAAGPGTGGEWLLLGSANLDPSTTYTLKQQPTVSNSFVSMRAAAVMFDFPGVPEPCSLALLMLGAAGAGCLRRRGG